MSALLPIIISFLIAAALLIPLVRKFLKYRKRESLLKSVLSASEEDILRKQVPLYHNLSKQYQLRLQGAINYFLTDKVFIGCNEFTINDEVRLTIAGNACLLVIGREKLYYPGFESILVYPTTYTSPQVSYDGLIESRHDSERSGESWHRGPIVLAWSEVVTGTVNSKDGQNVVLHEFAHKLDEENAIMDGLPILNNPEDYKMWAEVLTKEYSAFKNRVAHHNNKVIDSYGAVSAPEFFAVATESFFEKGSQMQKRIPELYQQFSRFYGLDTAHWSRSKHIEALRK